LSGGDQDYPAHVRVASGMAEIEAAEWDKVANPEPAKFDPFVSHAFLLALEESGSICVETGWLPQHLLLMGTGGKPIAAMPCYLKNHSMGEFVFDHGWADAYERAGVDYYPKLLCAVPVTPVPGRRFLIGPGGDPVAVQETLTAAAIELTRRLKASSLHITFVEPEQAARSAAQGLLQRTGHQYHFANAGYGCFEDFLATLSSRKRKNLKRERRDALANGISIEWLAGADITEAHWDAFFAFYMDTGGRKWGSPYLNRRFFSLLGETMAKDCLLVMAKREGRYIAGALNMIGAEALYGRYWGCLEQHPFLHFEVCYYQAIDFAIAHKLARVEAGAGGEHKLVRGYEPMLTHSAHWIASARFRKPIADYLEREREHVERQGEAMVGMTPFRRGQPPGSTED
jgi:predicted N-acyltransferase